MTAELTTNDQASEGRDRKRGPNKHRAGLTLPALIGPFHRVAVSAAEFRRSLEAGVASAGLAMSVARHAAINRASRCEMMARLAERRLAILLKKSDGEVTAEACELTERVNRLLASRDKAIDKLGLPDEAALPHSWDSDRPANSQANSDPKDGSPIVFDSERVTGAPVGLERDVCTDAQASEGVAR